MNFMLLGHIHDDIDALLGRWSMKMRHIDYLTIPLLMKLFIDVETQSMFSHVIEEVPDFKGFVEDYIHAKGKKALVHLERQQFKFYLHPNGWPLCNIRLIVVRVIDFQRMAGLNFGKKMQMGTLCFQ